MNINKNLKIGLAFVLFSGGILAGRNFTNINEKKTASQIYKEQLDIKADLKSMVPPDEFLSMEKRIGEILPKKKLTTVLGVEIYNPNIRTIDYKYFQDSIAHQQEILQEAFQYQDSFDKFLSSIDKLWRVKK